MPRTAGSLRAEPTARLAELQQQHPEWQVWLRLLDLSTGAVNDEGWRAPVDETALSTLNTGPQGPPLLHGLTLHLSASRVSQLVRRLAAAASEGEVKSGISLRQYQPSAAEALHLVSAAVRQAADEIRVQALDRGIDEGALGSLAHLASLPVLRSCGHLLEQRVPTYWQYGYCPVCAAWPTIAERRGLDRSRRLRCGRCAAGWEVEWLYCIYCGERDHRQLGSLEPDQQGEMLKVETCATCKGYLKSIATLQGFTAFELLLQDLETVELDLVALNRGYVRPVKSAFTLNVHVADHASRRDL
jgi:FdhE protein